MTKARAMALALLAVIASCDSGDPSAPSFDPNAPAIFVRSTADSVLVGRTMRVVAVATGDSATVAWPRFTWSSGDTTTAIVDTTGRVTGLNPGLAWIRAAFDGRTDSTQVTVTATDRSGGLIIGKVALSGTVQCALTTAGTATCLPTTTTDSVAPLVPLDGAGSLVLESFSASTTHRCGLNAAGTMYCWGSSTVGQFLDGSTSTTAAVTPVPAGGIARYRAVSVGTNYTCALQWDTNFTWCAGLNSSRQLGRTTTGNSDHMPASIANAGLSAGSGTALSASNGTSMCLTTTDDKLVCWGGSTTALPSYTSAETPIIGAARGTTHTCAVSEAGLIRCTGINSVGQIGNGPITSVVTSTVVAGNAAYASVTAAGNYTCALTLAGTLRCWGDFPNDRLRAAVGTRRREPVPLLTSVRFVSINATPTALCGVTTEQRYVCL